MTLRRGESLMVTIAIPVGILVFFGKVDALGSSIKGDPIDFLVPGVLALAVMSTAMVSLGIATGFERRYGVLKRLGSTPLSRAGLLTAKTTNVLIVEVLQAALIIAVGIAYPLAKLPDAIEAFAKLLPAAALTECVRAVLRASSLPVGALAVLVVWAIAAPLAAARWFRWEEG